MVPENWHLCGFQVFRKHQTVDRMKGRSCMIKVTLLGDSIRMIGYGIEVPALLREQFEVFQPNDNCRFAKYTLRGLFDWESNMAGSQIVHWNNGLWDICNLFGDGMFTSESEYVENMLRIADILIKR